MSALHQDIALPRGLDDYIEERARVVQALMDADAKRQEADQVMRESLSRHGLPSHCSPRISLERQIQEVDRTFWHRAFDATGLSSVMDAQARRDLDRQMEYGEVPAFTAESVRSTMQSMAMDADHMFRRGLVQIFAKLSDQYRSHSAFRVQRRSIVRGMVEPRFDFKGRQIGIHRASDEINDLDRVLCVLQGKRHQERALEAAMNQAFMERGEYEDDRIRGVPHKNGNLHLYILDDDLLTRINRIIAEYYGETLADGRKD